ncbi:MAG: ABC transporter ATP-binding protein [Candidatus Rokubacteria bacterium]|nr:ABC transporter ATP-binding protein [Candidatus Rokubacteria bacterium]
MRPLVQLREVNFVYPGPSPRRARRFTIRGLSFDIAHGEILGLVGPNSGGKTTVVRLLSKILEPDSGEILFQERSLTGMSRWELARLVAVVPQEVPQAFPFTVEQLVLMGRYPHSPGRFFESAEDLAIAREAMAATGVLELAPAPLESLSGGERQRAILARALAQEPKLLILDEPTAHLDLRYQAECAGVLRRLNRERGVTILLVSHDLNLAGELCHRLLLLAEGRLARVGVPEEVLEAAVLQAVYGVEVIVEKSPTGRGPLVQVAWPDAERR